eukprot:4982486-Pleurochrysis_carterae.AAC.2
MQKPRECAACDGCDHGQRAPHIAAAAHRLGDAGAFACFERLVHLIAPLAGAVTSAAPSTLLAWAAFWKRVFCSNPTSATNVFE